MSMVCILPKYGHRLTSIDSKSNAQIFEPGHETSYNNENKEIDERNKVTIQSHRIIYQCPQALRQK